MPLEPGSQLGPYEVVAPLGAGGMGEVYRARDPRLGREVAIKVLPAAVATDPERLARFEREARFLAAMNHPGIAAIFGVETAGGAPALVMELVEGPTLAERMEQEPLSPEDALGVARQMAEALEYAHDRGIVHRDLKPANVKLRSDGTVKILDFGLARAMAQDALADPESALSESPTLTERMTVAGMILGTAAFMSPEQARGKEADRRSDIFAFGAVAFEMLSGRRAFAGETISETLAAVMRDDPDWSALPESLSPRWRRLLGRCLEKDPRQRLQAIGEARIILGDIAANPSHEGEESAPAAARPRARAATVLPWAVAAVSLAAAVALWLRTSPGPAATELSVLPSTGELLIHDSNHSMAISPDGRTLAYAVRVRGTAKLRLRHLDTREEVDLAGTDGARNIFFSRDSEWIGFFDSRKMRKISVRGGTPVDLADAQQDRLGTWLDDGTIVYGPNVTDPLYRVSESGGAPVAITVLDSTKRERTHRFPNALDGGPWVVFTAQTVDSPGGYDDADIDAVNVETNERRHLFKGARRAVWAPGGYLILARGSDLYAVEIDPRNPRVTRDPVPVLSGVAGRTSAGNSEFCIADDGTLAWIPGRESEQLRQVGWFDRSGRWALTPIPAGRYVSLKLSPDGRSALVGVGPGGGDVDIWLADLVSGGMNPITHGGSGGSAAWLPGGARFAMSKNDSAGGNKVVVRRPDGSGGERVIFSASGPVNVTDVSPDGTHIVVCDYGLRKGRIYMVAVDGSGVQTLAAEGDGYELAGMLSPDGKWLAYVSNKTQREEVCVRRLDGRGGSWQFSTGGGGGIRWGRDGRELFFVSEETLHRVAIEYRGEDAVFGQPEKMFPVPPSPSEPAFRDYQYDPVNDRFCFTRPPEGSVEGKEIAISLRWTDRLASRMRGGRVRP